MRCYVITLTVLGIYLAPFSEVPVVRWGRCSMFRASISSVSVEMSES